MGLGLNFEDIFESIKKLPQTQKDVSKIATTTQHLQSPQFQQQLQDVRTEVVDYGTTLIVLQAVSTAAIVGMFLLQYRNSN